MIGLTWTWLWVYMRDLTYFQMRIENRNSQFLSGLDRMAV